MCGRKRFKILHNNIVLDIDNSNFGSIFYGNVDKYGRRVFMFTRGVSHYINKIKDNIYSINICQENLGVEYVYNFYVDNKICFGFVFNSEETDYHGRKGVFFIHFILLSEDYFSRYFNNDVMDLKNSLQTLYMSIFKKKTFMENVSELIKLLKVFYRDFYVKREKNQVYRQLDLFVEGLARIPKDDDIHREIYHLLSTPTKKVIFTEYKIFNTDFFERVISELLKASIIRNRKIRIDSYFKFKDISLNNYEFDVLFIPVREDEEKEDFSNSNIEIYQFSELFGKEGKYLFTPFAKTTSFLPIGDMGESMDNSLDVILDAVDELTHLLKNQSGLLTQSLKKLNDILKTLSYIRISNEKTEKQFAEIIKSVNKLAGVSTQNIESIKKLVYEKLTPRDKTDAYKKILTNQKKIIRKIIKLENKVPTGPMGKVMHLLKVYRNRCQKNRSRRLKMKRHKQQ